MITLDRLTEAMRELHARECALLDGLCAEAIRLQGPGRLGQLVLIDAGAGVYAVASTIGRR